MNRKPDYYGVLGLTPNATAADIEASYYAIVQHLDAKKVAPSLRRWAEEQLALVDEAYAALTEVADEEVDAEPVSRNRPGPAQAASEGRGRATPSPAATRRPARQDDYDDDEYDDEEYDELDDDYVVEQPRQQKVAGPPGRPQKAAQPATTRGTGAKGNRPQWQERGRGHGRGRGAAPATRYRQSAAQADDRMKKMLLGLGAGVLVVILAFVAVQYGIGPFGSSPSGDGQFAAQPPAKFDQARYEQLKGMLQKDPQSYAVLFELGEMHFQANRYPETIEWFTKLLEVKPDDVHAMQDIGTAHFNMGDRENARAMWLRALEVDPNDAQTHWNLSFLYATAQPPDLEGAVQAWQKVIELEPGSDLAQTAQQHLDTYKSRLAGGAAVPTPQR